MVFTFGTPMSYGILQEPLSESFGISPVALSTTFSIMLFTFFIGSGAVGIVSLRLPSRGVVLAASAVTGLLAPALYVAETYLALVLVFAVLGLALGTVFVLLASVVPRWFDDRRGAATGLIFVGNGLGLFLLPPVWQFAIGRFGVRQGFLLIMSVTALAFFCAGVTCRRPRWAETSAASGNEIAQWLSQLIRTSTFQRLFIGMALAFGWYQLLAAYAVDLFAYRGLTEAGASVAFGLIGGVSIISRIGGGYVSDVIGSKRAFLASLACAGAGIALLFVPQIPILSLGIFLIGIGLGGAATLYIPYLMQTYGAENNTAIVGIFNIAGGIGALVIPPLGTASVAYTNGYEIAILGTFVMIILSFWMIATGPE